MEVWLFKSESKPKIFLTILRCWSDFLKIADPALEIGQPIKSIKPWCEGTNLGQGSILAKMLVEITLYFFRVFGNANEYFHLPPSCKIWVMNFVGVKQNECQFIIEGFSVSYVADNVIKSSVVEKPYIRE